MNPGPETWQLSTCNPTGLTGKAAQFATLAPGIAAVSESHLTAQGLVQFRKELVGTKSPFAVMHSHPAPYRANAVKSHGGKQTGVCFLSTFPGRIHSKGFTKDLFETSRLASSHFWLDGEWLHGGVAYGHAHMSESPQVKECTDELLRELTKVVVSPNRHG